MRFGSLGPSWPSGLSPAVPNPSAGARASHLRDFSCCAVPALGPTGFTNCSLPAPELGLRSCTSSSKPSCYFVSLFRRTELYTKFLVVHPVPETRDLNAALSFPISQLPAPHPSPRPSDCSVIPLILADGTGAAPGTPCLPLAFRHAAPPFPS